MSALSEQARAIAALVRAQADAEDKLACISIANTASARVRSSAFQSVRETPSTIASTVLVVSEEDARSIAAAVDGTVDLIFVDGESKREQPLRLVEAVRAEVRHSEVLTVRPNALSAAALDQLVALERPNVDSEHVAVIGAGNLGARAGFMLCERGARVTLVRRNQKKLTLIVAGLRELLPDHLRDRIAGAPSLEEPCNVLIGATPGIAAINIQHLEHIGEGGLLVDAGGGTIEGEALAHAHERKLRVLGLFIRPAWTAHVESLLAQRELLRSHGAGRTIWRGVPIVSGGFIGQRGDVLVDDVSAPTRLLGIADGEGDTIPRSAWEPRHRESWSALEHKLRPCVRGHA